MTHEELLAKLLISDETKLWETLTQWQKALYAVVELHWPSQCSHGIDCNACGGMECATGYPCGTIQAIEASLL